MYTLLIWIISYTSVYILLVFLTSFVLKTREFFSSFSPLSETLLSLDLHPAVHTPSITAAPCKYLQPLIRTSVKSKHLDMSFYIYICLLPDRKLVRAILSFYSYFSDLVYRTVSCSKDKKRINLLMQCIYLVGISVLKRRRECGTYLATARRHRRRLKMQKRDE